jgi:hypothetical protein
MYKDRKTYILKLIHYLKRCVKVMKKKLILLMLLILSMILISGCSDTKTAPKESSFDKILSNVVTLKFLSEDGGIGVLEKPIDQVEGFIRFLLLIAIFALFFRGGQSLGMNPGTSIVLSVVISLISIIFIPTSLLVAAATGYGTLVSFFMIGLPIAIAFFAYYMFRENHWIRFALLVGIAFMIDLMRDALVNSATGSAPLLAANTLRAAAVQVEGWFLWIEVVVIIMAIWSLLSAVKIVGGGNDYHPSFLGRWFDKEVKQKVPGLERNNDLRHKRREETRLLYTLAAEEKEKKKLELVKEKSGNYETYVNRIKATREVKSKVELKQFNAKYEELKNGFSELKKAQNTWKRDERREVKEMKRLLDELHQKKTISDRAQKKLEDQHFMILGKFAGVQQNIDDADGLMKVINTNHASAYQSLINLYNNEWSSSGKTESDPMNISDFKAHGTNLLDGVEDKISKASSENSKLIVLIKDTIKEEELALQWTITFIKKVKSNWTLDTPNE